MKQKYSLFLLIIILLLPVLSFAQRFRVKVTRVVDGDTFTAINRDDLQLRFRLYGIDAPEKRQAFSNVSKKTLEAIIHNKTVIVEVLSTDNWGRHIAKVSTQSVKDVGAKMLERGVAWHYKQYDNSEEYSEMEKKARKNKIGLWVDPKPTPPWLWRKR
jgi:endonuclease YncB( thermonuclease family)